MKGKVLAYFFREAGTPYQGFVTGSTPEDIFHVLGKHGDPYSMLLLPITGTGGSMVAWENASGGGVPRQHECLYFESTVEFPLSRRDGWVTFVELFGRFDPHTGQCAARAPDGMGQLQPTATTAPPAPPAPPPVINIINNTFAGGGAGAVPVQYTPVQHVPARYGAIEHMPAQQAPAHRVPVQHTPIRPAPARPIIIQPAQVQPKPTQYTPSPRPANRWLDDGDDDGGDFGCLDDEPWVGAGVGGDGLPPEPPAHTPEPIAPEAPPVQACSPCLPIPPAATTDTGDTQPAQLAAPTAEPPPDPIVPVAAPTPVTITAPIAAPAAAPAVRKPAKPAVQAQPIPKPIPQPPAIPTAETPGQQFLLWLKEGIRSQQHTPNTPSSLVHTVPEGLLVTPRAFQAYSPKGWEGAQKSFLELKLHKQAPDGGDIWRYNVPMAGGTTGVRNGFLIGNPQAVLGLSPPNKTPSLPGGQPPPRRGAA